MAAAGFTTKFVRLRSQTGAMLVHPDLRPRLVEDAERSGISLTDQATKILAEKYGVPFAPTPRKTTPAKDGEELNVPLPDRLLAKMHRVTRPPRTIPDAIRETLSAHYDLPLPPKTSRRKAA